MASILTRVPKTETWCVSATLRPVSSMTRRLLTVDAATEASATLAAHATPRKASGTSRIRRLHFSAFLRDAR